MAPRDSVATQNQEHQPILRVEDLSVRFGVGKSGFWGRKKLWVHAVDGVSFRIDKGQTLGLVGESGSGKTTTGRAVLKLLPPSSGKVIFDGQDITAVSGEELRQLRRRMQLIFQDPYASLNPRMRIRDIIAEPLLVHGVADNTSDAHDAVSSLLQQVGLPADAADRYPHAFSGGQRQRIVIARAIALRPDFIVADEPVSALDVSIRAQVVNLLQDLQDELGLAYLFIAHDLSIVRHISHHIAVMYAGQIVELAPRDAIYENPTHPYTESLLSAVPIPDPRRERSRERMVYKEEALDPMNPPKGCRFTGRCPIATTQCHDQDPPLEEKGKGHSVACWNR